MSSKSAMTCKKSKDILTHLIQQEKIQMKRSFFFQATIFLESNTVLYKTEFFLKPYILFSSL